MKKPTARVDHMEARQGKHGDAIRSERGSTPDLMPGFQGGSRLDRAGKSAGHDMASVINGASTLKKSPSGPHCHLDGPATSKGLSNGKLGTGSDSLADAARSISSGARTPCVDWSKLK